MILKGNSRGGAKNLALHLMKDENEHVELHEVRGFAVDNLMGALNEAYAVSRGTKCKQFLYSLSLSPPRNEKVGIADFESAIERIEEKLGLSSQPRAIVFHEKEGRRHAHAVWSRINTDEMKAVQMSYDHKKLNTISRELFIEHGWKMPEGLSNSQNRDPKNFTLAEWQQAKRTHQDPRAVKTAIQDAWAISDSKAAFIHALEERGYRIARGDRRGFVALDMHGEIYSIAKQAGVKTKQVQARLGDESELSSVAETKKQIADEMLPTLDDFQKTLETQNQKRRNEFDKRRLELVQRQRTERQTFTEKIKARQNEETKHRQQRFRAGIKGLWDRMRGAHKRIAKENIKEAQVALIRDRTERDNLIFKQLDQRKHLHIFRMEARQEIGQKRHELQRDVEMFRGMRLATKDPLEKSKQRKRNRGPTLER
jgi:MobA/VirD2-like, nuclease domain